MKKSILILSLFILNLLSLEAYSKASEEEFIIILEEKPSLKSNRRDFIKTQHILNNFKNEIERKGGTVLDTYSFVFLGFLTKLNSLALNSLSKSPAVKIIVKNTSVYTNEENFGVRNWGLDRINQEDLPLDSSFSYNYTGWQSHIYVIDSGIRASHIEFMRSDKLGDGYNAIDETSPFEDCIGHGTHVSGIAAGKTAGVSKAAILHPVKVFGCSGSTASSNVLEAIDWVIENHTAPAVINMSLGGGRNEAYDIAVENANAVGISVVVSAGNSNSDACSSSPASAPGAITVAASTNNDKLASFSSWGSCVDIIAPGVSINSPWHKGDQSYKELSGTSMASPFVAGAVAQILQAYPLANPTEVRKELLENGNFDKIEDPKTSPNNLLYTLDLGKNPYVTIDEDYLVVKYPKKYFSITGEAKDPDGNIVQAFWSQISGPPAVSLGRWKQKLIINSLQLGTYVFRYEATDNEGRSSYDDITIFVAEGNMLPIADAGEDQIRKKSTDTVQLSGEGSLDYDGTIESYSWEQVFGPTEASFNKPQNETTKVENLEPGLYEFKLTVTDDAGDSTSDNLQLLVNAHPVVNAGEDQNLYFETGLSTTLTGSTEDSDGTIVKIIWVQKEGPSSATIESPDSLTTEVTGLQIGQYIFALKTMDNHGAQTQDKITVNVLEAPLKSF